MHRTDLLSALDIITTARRHAQGELDTTRSTQLAAIEPPSDEQLVQTLAALVRQLENAGRELVDAVRSVDQLGRSLAD